jgi:hypothetical protein
VSFARGLSISTVASLNVAGAADGTGVGADGVWVEGTCAAAIAATSETTTADRRDRLIWFGKTPCSKKQRAPSRGPCRMRGPKAARSQTDQFGGAQVMPMSQVPLEQELPVKNGFWLITIKYHVSPTFILTALGSAPPIV